MFYLLLTVAAGSMHPQVIECATAVRAQAQNTSAACSQPQVNLWGEDATPALTEQCAAALKAGGTVNRVPEFQRRVMRAEFEKRMQACELSVTQPAPQPKARETIKLWD